ncbi:hypothetical protein [Pararhodobacter zhoushanensis]|uniref:Uncharacterized protein n=1 Tax=Pararhodobacter zhoushanensis TaxID=2479545 RepID=A0ABT3H2Z9_9RHOB|nr:hypothetical protein [Pararhodobacter zhoushanensis]MCW1934141.1 hypothetical protein [Pararhodobacter zhoushanensis]
MSEKEENGYSFMPYNISESPEHSVGFTSIALGALFLGSVSFTIFGLVLERFSHMDSVALLHGFILGLSSVFETKHEYLMRFGSSSYGYYMAGIVLFIPYQVVLFVMLRSLYLRKVASSQEFQPVQARHLLGASISIALVPALIYVYFVDIGGERYSATGHFFYGSPFLALFLNVVSLLIGVCIMNFYALALRCSVPASGE